MLQNEVFVCNASPATLKRDVERILERSRLMRYYNPEKKTIIKINANYDRKYPGCNTSTWFLDALLVALENLNFTDLTVVENDLKFQPAEQTMIATGLQEVLNKHEIPFLNLKHCPRGNDEIPLLINEAQIINTPVIHTHTFAVISCASKNLFGLLPIYREKYHDKLSEKLLELVQLVNPCFTLVDGTIGQEGSSMRMGDPVKLGLVVAGWNPIFVDVVVSRIMGFSPDNVPLLRLADEKKLLPKAIVINGDYNWDSLPNHHFKYRRPALSRLDMGLRENNLTKKLFEYGSFADNLAQRLRRTYLALVYLRKKGRLYKELWTEYMTEYVKDHG